MLPSIEMAPGAEDNGFAAMLAGLLRQNLDDHPHKQRDFRKLSGRVAIVVEDAAVSVTLQFMGGRLRVHDGIVGIPDLTIRGSSDDITNMSLIELEPRFGLPNLRGEATQAMLRASIDSRVKTYGLLTNLPFVTRLIRVMSIN